MTVDHARHRHRRHIREGGHFVDGDGASLAADRFLRLFQRSFLRAAGGGERGNRGSNGPGNRISPDTGPGMRASLMVPAAPDVGDLATADAKKASRLLGIVAPAFCLLALLGAAPARAEDGYELWLRYHPIAAAASDHGQAVSGPRIVADRRRPHAHAGGDPRRTAARPGRPAWSRHRRWSKRSRRWRAHRRHCRHRRR